MKKKSTKRIKSKWNDNNKSLPLCEDIKHRTEQRKWRDWKKKNDSTRVQQYNVIKNRAKRVYH